MKVAIEKNTLFRLAGTKQECNDTTVFFIKRKKLQNGCAKLD